MKLDVYGVNFFYIRKLNLKIFLYIFFMYFKDKILFYVIENKKDLIFIYII